MRVPTLAGGLGDTATCERAQVTLAEAAPKLVGDVMLKVPKTLSALATLDDARAFFANPKVVNALIVDGTAFVGMLYRTDLPSLLPGALPIRTFAKRSVPTITADRPVGEAIEILDAARSSRLVVVAADGVTLVGLLCLDLQRGGFCAS